MRYQEEGFFEREESSKIDGRLICPLFSIVLFGFNDH